MAVIRTEMDPVKADIEDIKGRLSMWSDEVVSVQATITSLQNQVTVFKDRCEDMEGRMRRDNIRIIGIEEKPDSLSPDAFAKIIKEALQMDRVKVACSHHTLAPRKPGDQERPPANICQATLRWRRHRDAEESPGQSPLDLLRRVTSIFTHFADVLFPYVILFLFFLSPL